MPAKIETLIVLMMENRSRVAGSKRSKNCTRHHTFGKTRHRHPLTHPRLLVSTTTGVANDVIGV